MKLPNLPFYGGCGHTTTNFPSSFWAWMKSLRIQLQQKVACIFLTYWTGQKTWLTLKERKFIFLPTFSLPSSPSLLKVPNDPAWWRAAQLWRILLFDIEDFTWGWAFRKPQKLKKLVLRSAKFAKKLPATIELFLKVIIYLRRLALRVNQDPWKVLKSPEGKCDSHPLVLILTYSCI